MGDVMAEFYDGPHATPPASETGAIYLGIKNITDDGRLDLDKVRRIAEADYATWTKRVEPRAGDLVFTYEATLHRYAVLPSRFRGTLGRRVALIRPRRDRVATRYLHYVFLSPQWRRSIEQRVNIGSTVDRIPLIDFPQYPIVLPPLEYQYQVVRVLGAIDDLIEGNRQRIEILETMARLLYREWFVRFRFPGHEDVEFADSDLGPIPKGWSQTCLAKELELQRFNIKPFEYADEEFEHYSIPAFDERRLPSQESGSEIKSGKYLLSGESVMVSKLNPRFPRVWRVDRSDHRRRAVASTEFLVLANPKRWTLTFVYGLATSPEFAARLATTAGGTSTSHQRVKPVDVMNMAVVSPPLGVVQRYSGQVQPLLKLADNLRDQAEILREARDLLLPRLVAGDLDVSELDLGLAAV